jgi:HEPN domain-containing protein
MNRADLQRLSDLRIEEAKVLFAAAKYAGAFYLAGYAVECALKACIAKQTSQYDFPELELVRDSYTHNLDRLLKVAGLENELRHDQRSNRKLALNWDFVKSWEAASRYNTSVGEREATDLIFAISDPANGVLVWLKRWW